MEYKPVQAITIYKNDSSDFYIESSNIVEKDGKFTNTMPVPLKEDTLKKLSLYFTHRKVHLLKFSSVISSNILHYKCTLTDYAVIWYVPSHKEHLYFKGNLAIPDGIADVPPVIFRADPHGLDVFAVRQKPNVKTALYRAPFHNVSDDGDVCLGNVNIKDKFEYVEELISAYETAFWKSIFSEVHGTPWHSNVNLLWKELINSKAPFPISELTKTSLTLEDLIND